MPFDIMGYDPNVAVESAPIPAPEGAGVPTDMYSMGLEGSTDSLFSTPNTSQGIPAPVETQMPTPTNDVGKAVGELGSLSELATGAWEGAKYGIPGMLAQSAQFLGVGGQTAKDISAWSEAGQAQDPTILKQAGQMMPMSAGVQLAIGTLGRALLAFPTPQSKAIGAALVATAPYLTPIIFGLSQGQQTKEAAEEAGVEPGAAPLTNAAIETFGETIANWGMEKSLGPLAGLSKVAKAFAAKVGVASALKGTVASFLKTLGFVTLPTEIGTEMFQNAAEAQVEKSSGIRPQAQPGMEAISAIAPTGIMTVVMASLGMPIRNHMINKQAQILSQPAPKEFMEGQDNKAEDWQSLRFNIAKQVNGVIPTELQPQWEDYYTNQITNNLPIDISKPIERLGIAEPAVETKPTPITKAEGKEGKVEPSGLTSLEEELGFLHSVGTKLADKKTKDSVELDEIEGLLNQEGKSGTFSRIADQYLSNIINKDNLEPLKLAFPSFVDKIDEITNPLAITPGVKPGVAKAAAPIAPIAPIEIEDADLTPENQTLLNKLIATLPAKPQVTETGETVGPRLLPELGLEEQRKKIIEATKGKITRGAVTPPTAESERIPGKVLKEELIAPISIPYKEFRTYSHGSAIDEVIKKNPDGTVSRFTVEGYATAKVGKKNITKSVSIRPKPDLPEPYTNVTDRLGTPLEALTGAKGMVKVPSEKIGTAEKIRREAASLVTLWEESDIEKEFPTIKHLQIERGEKAPSKRQQITTDLFNLGRLKVKTRTATETNLPGADVRLKSKTRPVEVIEKHATFKEAPEIETTPKLSFLTIVNDKNPPNTKDELVTFIAKKKAEGLDVSDIVTNLKKADYLSKYLTAIHKAVDKKIKSGIKRTDELKGEKVHKPAPKLSDVEKALYYVKKEGEIKPYVLEHQDDTGKMVATIHDTLTEAENHAKKLNAKYAVRGTIQKGQEDRYSVGSIWVGNDETISEIKTDENDKILNKDGEQKWVVTSKQVNWKTIKEKGTKQARQQNNYLAKAYEIFDTKLKNDISNSLEFIKDVLLPFMGAKLKKYKYSAYKVQPTDEQSQYYMDNSPSWPEKQHHAVAGLFERLQKAVSLNFVKPKVEQKLKLEFIGAMDPELLKKLVLKPVDELVFETKDLKPFFEPGEMEGAILPALVATEDGWAALNHFDAAPTHKITKLSKEQQAIEDKAAKVRKELAKIEKTRVQEEVIKEPEPKKTAREIKAEAAKKKRVAEEKEEGVRIIRDVEELEKDTALPNLVYKAYNAGLLKEEKMGPSVLKSIVNKLSWVLSPLGKKTIKQNQEKSQDELVGTIERIPIPKKGMDKYKERVAAYKKYKESIAKQNRFLIEIKGLLGVNTDLKTLEKEDIPKLLNVYDFIISHRTTEGVETGITNQHDANAAQTRDLLGMQEEGKAETGVNETTRKKQGKLKTLTPKTSLEEIASILPAEVERPARTAEEKLKRVNEIVAKKKKARTTKAKGLSSETTHYEVIKILNDDLDLAEEEATVKFMLTQADKILLKDLGYTNADISKMKPDEGVTIIERGITKGETITNEDLYKQMLDDGIFGANGEEFEMAMGSIHVVSEYVAKTKPSTTFQEFKLSMHEFLGKTWDRIKGLAKYLWNRISFMRGVLPANTEPMNMSIEGENRRIPRHLLKNIPALYKEIQKRAKNKAVEFNSAYRANGDEGLRIAADTYSKFSAFNVANESQNRKDFNNMFETVIKLIYPAISNETLTKLKSFATQRGMVKLGTVTENMIQITGRLQENGTVESTFKSRKETAKKYLSPWMLSEPADTTYSRAIKIITEAFRNMPRNFRNAITLSDNWILVNDNPGTRYIARRITPAFKAAFDSDISRVSGVAFNIDTAIANPGAFTGPIKVTPINHPFNPNSTIPTRIIEVGGSMFTLRNINDAWHFIFPNVAEMFTPGNVEMLKAIDKADYEGRELAETKGMNMTVIDAVNRFKTKKTLTMPQELNPFITPELWKESLGKETSPVYDINGRRITVSKDNLIAHLNKKYRLSNIDKAKEVYDYIISTLKKEYTTFNSIKDFDSYIEMLSVTGDEVIESIKALKTTKTEQVNVTKEYLQKLLPKATITQVNAEKFHIEFQGGAWFDMETNPDLIPDGEGGAIGRWQISQGKGKMQIYDIAYLASNDIKTPLEYRGVIEHEILHMVSEFFMTKEEQAMLLSTFKEDKNESDKETWEHVAEYYRLFGSKPNSNIFNNVQRTWLGKLQENIKNLIFLVKEFIFPGRTSGYRTPDALFTAIRNGEITTRTPQLNLIGSNSKFYLRSLQKGALPIIIKGKTYDPNIAEKRAIIKATTDPINMSLMKWAHNTNLEGELPLIHSAFDSIKDFVYRDEAAFYKHKLVREMKWYEQILSNPMFKASATEIDKRVGSNTYGQRIQKYPAWTGAVKIERDRFHKNANNGMEYVKSTEMFHSLLQKEADGLDPIFEHGTTISNKYLTEPELRSPQVIERVYKAVGSKLTNYTLSERQIKGYLEVTKYLKETMFPKMIEHIEDSLIGIYMNALNTNEYAELQRLYKSLVEGKIVKDLEATLKRPEFIVKNPYTGLNQNRLAAAYKNLSGKLQGIRAERAKIEFGGGYMPLRRPPSSHYVAVQRINPDGSKTLIESYSAFGTAFGDRLITALKEKFPEFADESKYSVFIGASTKPNDSTFFMVGDINTARIIDLAMAKLSANADNKEATLSIEQAHDLSDALCSSIADIMKARGAGISAIGRNLIKFNDGTHVIKGYIKEDFRKILDGYVYGYYGMQSKFDAANEYMELLKGLKASEPKMYSQVSEYAKNNLRNMDEWDRRTGKIKGFMFYWYLAGKYSMAIIQMTQNFVTAIPLMAVRMRDMGIKGHVGLAETIMLKALLDTGVTKKNQTKEEKAMIEYFKSRGDTMAQYVQSIKAASKGTGGKVLAGLDFYLSWPMKVSEEFNREAAVLAYYRMLTQNGKRDVSTQEKMNKVYTECEDFMYHSHWWYSKANAPTLAHGADTFSRLANLAYTFRPFTHNYVLSLAYAFQNYGGKGGALYAARSFAWLAFIGGIPALPWIDDFIELIEKWTGIPIRMQARHAVEKLAGTTASRFTGAGLFGALMKLDISAAVRPAGLPFVGDATQSVFGVYSGAAQKITSAYKELRLGEGWRAVEDISPTAIENAIKGYRLWDKGATTTAKNPAYGPNGKELKLSGFQAILQGFGSKNYDYSISMGDTWEKRVILQHYNDIKSDLVKKQHLAETPLDKAEVRLEMNEFNKSIPQYLRGVVSKVEWVPLQKPDKGMNKLRLAMSRE